MSKIDLDALEQAALSATPGPWDIDSVKNEGDYGIGPDDCRTGFMSHCVIDKDGKVLFDSLNRDEGLSEIREEYSDDSVYAWDEKSKRDIEYTVAANPSVIIELIRRLREAERDAERLDFALHKISGKAWREAGVYFPGGRNKDAIDDAMSQESNNG